MSSAPRCSGHAGGMSDLTLGWGGGVRLPGHREGSFSALARMISATPSIFVITSEFPTRRTVKPRCLSRLSRCASFTRSCVSPSTSIASPTEGQKKSMIACASYITCWRRNLCPPSWSLERMRHKRFSGSVGLRRISRARFRSSASVFTGVPHPNPSPEGEGLLVTEQSRPQPAPPRSPARSPCSSSARSARISPCPPASARSLNPRPVRAATWPRYSRSAAPA